MSITVFISSTSRDLLDHRAAVAKAVRGAGYHAIDMADFGARPEGATTACLEEVAQADLFVGFYAWRYGFVPEGAEISITEQEFDEAERLEKPRFCFTVDEEFEWPDEHREKGIGARALREFKARIDATLVRDTFTTPEHLANKVLESLIRWEKKPKITRLPFEPETVEIPAGPFLMGREPGKGATKWESPQEQIKELPAFRIGKYPVTNKQYEEFVLQTKPRSLPIDWEDKKLLPDKEHHPVRGVTWYDALAYCEWLTDQTKAQAEETGQPRIYTLPSEAQWEKAARGTDGQLYPWGDEWDPTRCNHKRNETTPVTAPPDWDKPNFRKGGSPFGCYDMVGNVREWTSTIWGIMRPEPGPKFSYPWQEDGRDDLEAGCYLYRVYRGGGAADDQEFLTCSARAGYAPLHPGPPGNGHGFRVVVKI
jgi:formylglycine-generating enzyme required for sulfatase activity